MYLFQPPFSVHKYYYRLHGVPALSTLSVGIIHQTQQWILLPRSPPTCRPLTPIRIVFCSCRFDMMGENVVDRGTKNRHTRGEH